MSKKVGLFLCPKGGGYANGIQNATLAKIDEAGEKLQNIGSSVENVEVHAYVKNGKYCVVNNTYEPQDTTVYTGDGSCFDLHLDTNEIKWYSIEG